MKRSYLYGTWLIITALALLVGLPVASHAASVEPVLVEGNPTCIDLGYGFGFKVDPPNSGTYTFPDGHHTVSVTVSEDGIYADFDSTLSVDAVIVKGGPQANVYEYDPEVFSDDGLHAPVNSSGGYAQISHLDFCYDYEVTVTKTAATAFDRTFSWSIDKTADPAEVVLSTGQQLQVGYTVSLTSGFVDSNWAAAGEISIENASPFTATVTGVTDVVSPAIGATVDCGGELPMEIAPWETLTCGYSVSLPDATDRVNSATVTTTGIVGGGSGSAPVLFASAAINPIDECVAVTDTYAGDLGSFCAPGNVTYSRTIGPYSACGDYTVENTASFVTGDSGATGSKSANVAVSVPCDPGCTLTQGYWKTHSRYGPAPYDDAWAQLEDGEDTVFFLSGQTYYEVLWTAPKGGNAYYILAHQYIAAELNGLNGASMPDEVSNAMTAAAEMLETYTPDDVAGWKGKQGTELRAQMLGYAFILDQYNNGLIEGGPGHCSE